VKKRERKGKRRGKGTFWGNREHLENPSKEGKNSRRPGYLDPSRRRKKRKGGEKEQRGEKKEKGTSTQGADGGRGGGKRSNKGGDDKEKRFLTLTQEGRGREKNTKKPWVTSDEEVENTTVEQRDYDLQRPKKENC